MILNREMSNKEELLVIIPAYEPPKEFTEYAKKAALISKRLIVVNDGSSDEYDCIFDEIRSIENAEVISYKENRGKGYALKQAYKFCAENFPKEDVIVTADCDGQHKIEDVLKVYGATADHKDCVMLGARDMTEKNVPKRSRMGNASTRRMFSLFYGIKLSDSQTGLRGHTVEIAEKFARVKGNRFDYEHATLIWAKKNKVSILETPIQTVYPDDPQDHVSHFKAFGDSVKILGVMLKNLGMYGISSALSAILDVLIFYILTRGWMLGLSAKATLIATVAARVCSSVLNFSLNYKYVFGGRSKRSIYRYYILWLLQLGASYGLVYLFVNTLNLPATVMKVAGDLFLALVSYQVQQNWVFKEKSPRKFFTPFAGFVLPLLRRFSKKYRCNVLPYDEPVVYVARHLNTHGPFTTIKWLNFDVHPMVLNCFFRQKDCYRQFNDFTFSVRQNKKKRRFGLKAFVSSIFVSKSIRALKAVPVYRNGKESVKTFKKAMECLQKGESLIVYPDIEYTASSDKISDIYDGFLYLGQLYYKRTGKELRFVPIYINDEKRSINEKSAVIVNDFKQDAPFAKEYLENAINNIDAEREYL